MPTVVVSAKPTPDELGLKLAAHDAQLRVLTEATAQVWDARHLGKRMDAVEVELRDNTRSTIRTEALVEELLGPLVHNHTAKLDTCLHYIASSSHVSATLGTLGDKLDDLNGALSSIRTDQATAAERFEAHDLRDQAIEKVVHSIDQRVQSLEQRNDVQDATSKLRKLVARSNWWRSPIAKAGAAVLTALAAAITAYFGLKG